MILTIKCACEYPDCVASIVIRENNYVFVYDQEGKATHIRLPPPVAKAIRDACKVMEDNDIDY